MSQLYERELKGILMADPDVLARVTKNLPQEEAIRYMRIMNKPFVVVRAACSFGIDMAVVGTVSFLVEEKSSVEGTYNFNAPMVKEQAAKLKDLCSRAGICIACFNKPVKDIEQGLHICKMQPNGRLIEDI